MRFIHYLADDRFVQMHKKMECIHAVEHSIWISRIRSRSTPELHLMMTLHCQFHHLAAGIKCMSCIVCQSTCTTRYLQSQRVLMNVYQPIQHLSLLPIDKHPVTIAEPTFVVLARYAIIIINDFVLCHKSCLPLFIVFGCIRRQRGRLACLRFRRG